ncbi:MAG: DapH/DapD/GlmU-related protein [Candidatus Thiodiazotropha sp.]
MGPGVKIWTQNHIFDDPDKPINESGYSYAPVSIGKDIWIGANSFIMPGTIIGNGCVISAHSCVGGKNWLENSIIEVTLHGKLVLEVPNSPCASTIYH